MEGINEHVADANEVETLNCYSKKEETNKSGEGASPSIFIPDQLSFISPLRKQYGSMYLIKWT